MSNDADFIADRAMTLLTDATADVDSIPATRAAVLRLKERCDQKLAELDEIEHDMRVNPQFYKQED